MNIPQHDVSGGVAVAAPPVGDEGPRLRLTLKPAGRPTGAVDGAWWPRSRALAEELLEVMARLEERIGPISRVGYSLLTWPAAPRRLTVAGQIVRLGGFFSVPPDVIDLFGPRGRVCLLVIPPETLAVDAQRVLTLAAKADNIDDVATLLHLLERDAEGDRTTASNRRETDGGTTSQ